MVISNNCLLLVYQNLIKKFLNWFNKYLCKKIRNNRKTMWSRIATEDVYRLATLAEEFSNFYTNKKTHLFVFTCYNFIKVEGFCILIHVFYIDIVSIIGPFLTDFNQEKKVLDSTKFFFCVCYLINTYAVFAIKNKICC